MAESKEELKSLLMKVQLFWEILGHRPRTNRGVECWDPGDHPDSAHRLFLEPRRVWRPPWVRRERDERQSRGQTSVAEGRAPCRTRVRVQPCATP